RVGAGAVARVYAVGGERRRRMITQEPPHLRRERLLVGGEGEVHRRLPADLHRAVLDDGANTRRILEDLDVRERIAVDDDQIGALALHERAELLLDAEALRRQAGRGLQRLHRRETRLDETPQLTGIR